ncbi:hypothetical protein FACS1894113_1750 [Alphaproteobacteria bacterium]|nr:hypothetical protein FACS1894113_1750 [Alphaproteobacteria bacterium]
MTKMLTISEAPERLQYFSNSFGDSTVEKHAHPLMFITAFVAYLIATCKLDLRKCFSNKTITLPAIKSANRLSITVVICDSQLDKFDKTLLHELTKEEENKIIAKIY